MKSRLFCITVAMIFAILHLSSNSNSQPVTISSGVIPNRYPGERKVIPIHGNDENLHVFTISSNWDGGSGDVYFRDSITGSWDFEPFGIEGIFAHDIEYFYDNSGISYVYGSYRDSLFYRHQQDLLFNIAYSPGRPLIDFYGNIHVIWEGNGDSANYGYSTDTLNTFEIYESFQAPGDFIYLVPSPNNHLIGGLFFDSQHDSLYKYIAQAGEPIDFSSPTEVIYCDTYIGHASDIMLDYQGDICFTVNVPGGWGWGIHSFWSEEWGLRHLGESGDDVFQGTCYQISYGPEVGEIVLIHGENFMGSDSKFFYSPDGGNIWYLSSFNLNGTYYGSARRTYSDTLHFVYYIGDYDNFTTHHYPIPIELILDDLTNINETERILPNHISLSNYPNPFNSSTNISFALPEAGHVRLDVYDIAGRLVSTLFNADADAGQQTVSWDGTDEAGRPVSSGIYFYTLRSGEISSSRRMLLLK